MLFAEICGALAAKWLVRDGNDKDDEHKNAMIFDEEHLQSRLALVRRHVARPIPPQPWTDPTPALVPFRDDAPDEGGILIAGARHAANLPLLRSLHVTAVLNCASGVSAAPPVL